jgi:hypothetical protein
MAYIVPKVLIQQEFTQIPVYAEFPLAAFIVGPHYSLTRYDVADEKPYTKVSNPSDASLGNAYQATADVTYDVPNVPAGGNTDPTYTKVFFEDAVASYFPLAELGAEVNTSDDYVDFVGIPNQMANYKNRVRFETNTGALKTAHGYARSPFLSDRDVRVGDLVTVTDEDGVSLNTSVKSLIRDTYMEDWDLSARSGYWAITQGANDGVLANNRLTSVSSNFTEELTGQFVTIQGITIDTGTSYKVIAVLNSTTLLLDRSVATPDEDLNFYFGGIYQDPSNVRPSNTVIGTPSYLWRGLGANPGQGTFAATNSTVTYVGHRNLRVMEDTYTVVLTSGNSAINARFSIRSAAGAFAPKSNVALTGTTLTLDRDDANVPVTLSFSGTTSWVGHVGKGFEVSVSALTQTAVVQSGGDSYKGKYDTTYKITVVRGGAFFNGTNGATCAKVSVTSSGVDSSAAIPVAYDTYFNVGNQGVRASFDNPQGSANGGLILGDSYYVEAKAARLGAVRVIELNNDLPASTLANGNDMYINLSLKKNSVEISKIRDLEEGTLNWEQNQNYVTVNSGVTISDPSITVNGVEAKLTASKGDIFIHHRDLLQDNIVSIGAITSEGEVSRKLGTVHPDNPLAQGVYDAVLNANGAFVYFLGVQTDDLEGYNNALEIAKKSDKVYGFVPLTFDRAVHDAFVGHVNAFSSPSVGLWRVTWLSIQDEKSSTIYGTKADGSSYLGTITQDPEAPVTQLNLVSVAGASFLDDGVRPTDSLRLNFRTNVDGTTSYDEYIVDEVRTQTTLTLTTSVASAISSGVKVEIVRNFTRDERANNIALIGGSYMNRRVRVVFPDTYKYNGVEKAGYFMAAALAGLRSGVVPHQGLTNTVVLGADDLSKVVNEFTQDQLNLMAEHGIWLVVQAVVGATPYVRHQLTTDSTGLNTSEDSITTNVDNISYALKHTLTPFVGTYNINPVNIQIIRDAIIKELVFRATQTFTARAGNQLVSFTPATDIILIQQDPTYKDRIDVEVKLNVPYPLNYISLKLLV